MIFSKVVSVPVSALGGVSKEDDAYNLELQFGSAVLDYFKLNRIDSDIAVPGYLNYVSDVIQSMRQGYYPTIIKNLTAIPIECDQNLFRVADDLNHDSAESLLRYNGLLGVVAGVTAICDRFFDLIENSKTEQVLSGADTQSINSLKSLKYILRYLIESISTGQVRISNKIESEILALDVTIDNLLETNGELEKIKTLFPEQLDNLDMPSATNPEVIRNNNAIGPNCVPAPGPVGQISKQVAPVVQPNLLTDEKSFIKSASLSELLNKQIVETNPNEALINLDTYAKLIREQILKANGDFDRLNQISNDLRQFIKLEKDLQSVRPSNFNVSFWELENQAFQVPKGGYGNLQGTTPHQKWANATLQWINNKILKIQPQNPSTQLSVCASVQTEPENILADVPLLVNVQPSSVKHDIFSIGTTPMPTNKQEFNRNGMVAKPNIWGCFWKTESTRLD